MSISQEKLKSAIEEITIEYPCICTGSCMDWDEDGKPIRKCHSACKCKACNKELRNDL